MNYEKYKQTELTYVDTRMLQGLSVLAMVILHLFDRLDYSGLYTPVLFLAGKPLIFYIAQLSDFCVMGFAFCSGYALYKQFQESDISTYVKRRGKGLLVLLINYWVVLFAFTIISVLAGNGENMPGSIGEFAGNFFAVNTTYNGAWWYIFIYMVLVVISPLIFKYCDRFQMWISGAGLLLVYASAYYVRFYMPTTNWGLIKYGTFGMTLFEFCIGIYFLKYNWMEKINKLIGKLKKWQRIFIGIVLLVGILIGHTLIVPSLFVAPFTGILIIVLFLTWNKSKCAEAFFMLIGKHSTNIWLIHMFFYLYIFKNLVYVGRYPVIILGLMLGICIACSYLLNMVLEPMTRRVKNR